MRQFTLTALILAAATPALAQSNVDPVNKFAWGENIGWTNWHDAGTPAGNQGVVVSTHILSGFVWAENIGWINLGDGTPAAGTQYANATGTDFGVNRDAATGDLFGLAWGENVGWINFNGGALAGPPNPARIASVNGVCRLAGYAWGENIGWINLDAATAFVAVPGACGCDLNADLNHDNVVDLADLSILLSNYGLLSGATHDQGELTGDGRIDLGDLSALLSQYGVSCP